MLSRKGVVAAGRGEGVELSTGSIDHIADLQDARAGSLCWLSQRRFDAAPAVARDFAGSLLIAPPNATGERVLACRDPKLAFVLAASHFLSAGGNGEWAAPGADVTAPSVDTTARIGAGVFIGTDVVIREDAVIGPNTCLQHVTVGSRSVIGANCSIGGPGFGLVWNERDGWLRFPHVGRVEIEDDVEIGSNTCIDRGALGDTRIRKGARIDNLVHIAHNADIGSNALIIANAMVAGSAVIGERAWIAPSAAIMNQLSVGAGAVVGLGAVVVKSVEAGTTVVGNPAKPLVPREKGEKSTP
jgi:UDP-3-O-[3-hydroxymyristoyl] glucosamine N-acyltransferase